MVPLVQRLAQLLQALLLGPRTHPDEVRDLLRALAAAAIQDDPGQAMAPPGEWPGEVLEAIERGAADAAALNAAGLRLHIAMEVLPLASPSGLPTDHPVRIYGPFVDPEGRLVRFAAFESPAFLTIVVRSFVAPDETMLLVPADSTPNADLREWTLPSGSVWIRAGLLAPAAQGFAGLRIAGGRLTFTGGAPPTREGTKIVALTASPFTLSVVPETPDAPGAGSDVAAVTLTLPDRLDVTIGAAPEVIGGVALTGFGSPLSFTAAATAPFVANGLCCFPLAPDSTAWTIDGNRSALAVFSGAADVRGAAWALPISTLQPGEIRSAPHGGSLTASVTGTLTVTATDLDGLPFTWFASTLTVNRDRLEFNGLQLSGGGRMEFATWAKARSEAVFHQHAIAGMQFRSERGGQDALSIRGGALRNRWDLPRQADARPLPFSGDVDIFGILADAAGGEALLTCLAHTQPANESCGLALENLYIVVRPPKRCALAVALDRPERRAPNGLARLFLDARFGVPMLPDPYAANVGVRDPSDTFQELLHLDLSWISSEPPSVRAHLDGDLRLSVFEAADVQRGEDGHPPPDRTVPLFHHTIAGRPEVMFLLDLSSREDLFGVALEPLAPRADRAERVAAIHDNSFAVPLSRVRLFMQPQVHWEPLWAEGNPNVPQLQSGILHSLLDGGMTLVGAADQTTVAAAPTAVRDGILRAIQNQKPAATVFALPFGLRAAADLTRRPIEGPEQLAKPVVETSIHEPDFGTLHSARQLRLVGRQRRLDAVNPADRVMPGMLQQLANLNRAPVTTPGTPASVLSDVTTTLNTIFSSSLPLHQVDLSGYGLSTFSEWSKDTESGITKVHFHVLNGRASYEVIQVRTRLYECTAPVVRTFTMARHNSAAVVLTDSGWVPVGDGEFVPVKVQAGGTAPFAHGMVRAYRRIRRITTTGGTIVTPAQGPVPSARFATVVFDADLEIDTKDDRLVTVPLLNRTGYVYLPDSGNPAVAEQLRQLFQQVGVVTSPINSSLQIANTLGLHATSVAADFAPDDAGSLGFGVALAGNPQLPRAGQWSVVKRDTPTSAASPIDQRRGVPLVQMASGDIVFGEPSQSRRSAAPTAYALLMATPTSRVLFPQPTVKPSVARKVFCAAPLLADPYSLVQTAAAFPGAGAAIPLKTPATFATLGDAWELAQTFRIDPQAGDLMNGGEWSIGRAYPGGDVKLAVDSAANALWDVAAPSSDLKLKLPAPLNDILKITTEYAADSAGLPKLDKPKIDFTGPLEAVKDIITALGHFLDTGFTVDVNVVSIGSGASPSFLVQLNMRLRIGSPAERIDIGVGKFFGEFFIRGDLAIGAAGAQNPRLELKFQGDIQQGILPPLLYAGGLFRFGVTIPSTGRPIIELSLGVVASIGGDLIKGVLEVEVTVHYGYTLIPETLQPGVLLGLDARAKLLSGLVGFSFGVEAMGRIQRASLTGVLVWAHIRVAATVQIAWLIEEDVDFETEFEQNIPLAVATLAVGGGALAGLAAAVEA